MTELSIKLTERAAQAWAQRARREGHASAGEAVGAWPEREAAEELDPAEVAILRERSQSDPADDIAFTDAVRHLASKHGIH